MHWVSLMQPCGWVLLSGRTVQGLFQDAYHTVPLNAPVLLNFVGTSRRVRLCPTRLHSKLIAAIDHGLVPHTQTSPFLLVIVCIDTSFPCSPHCSISVRLSSCRLSASSSSSTEQSCILPRQLASQAPHQLFTDPPLDTSSQSQWSNGSQCCPLAGTTGTGHSCRP